MAPRWSILLPTHDRADVVGYAIRSVLAQTVEDWELLVVGDGCTDDTGDVVTGFGDDRIRWFDLPKAPGFGYANRNLAMREAEGSLVGFMAHDDLLLPDHLERMGPLFDRRSVEWAYSRPLWIENDGTIVPFAFDLRRPDALDTFLNGSNRIPASCIVHRRSCYDDYGWWPEQSRGGGDYVLWKQILGPSKGANLDYQPAPTCLHFRAAWRVDPSFGPPPLSTWLGTAHSGWWPDALRVPVPDGTLPQQVVLEHIEADPAGWTARCREAVVSVIDGFAWNAGVEIPELERWMVERAGWLIERQEYQAVVELVDRGLALSPASPVLRTVKARALLLDGDPVAAEALAREALELNGRLAPALRWLTQAILDQGRTDEAMASARAAIETRPDVPVLRVQYGEMLLQAGDVDGAEALALEAAELNYRAPGPKRLLDGVERARGGPPMATALDNARALYLTGIRDGEPRKAVARHTGNRYTQHSTGVPNGQEGFVEFFDAFLERHPQREIDIVRGFQDGDLVFLHVTQRLDGGEARWITMDVLRADEQGRMIEHWDVIAEWVDESVSGRSQVDGPTTPTDLDATEANKELVTRFIGEVLADGHLDRLADFISTESYAQHDPLVGDGIEGLRAYLAAMAAEGKSMRYLRTHIVVGSGDMVATLSRVDLGGTDTAVIDLFRVADGRIVEHWDVMEPVPAAEDLVNSGKF